MRSIPQIVADINQAMGLLAFASAELLEADSLPPDPTGDLSLRNLQEVAGMFKFDIGLPALPADASKIVGGKLLVVIDDGDVQSFDTTPEQTSVTGLTGRANAAVSRSFRYVGPTGLLSIHPLQATSKLPQSNTPPDPTGDLPLVVQSEIDDTPTP